MAKKYRVYMYAVKWNGKNITEVEEVANETHVAWEGSSTDGVKMTILIDTRWVPLNVGEYLVRQCDGRLSIEHGVDFEQNARYIGDADIEADTTYRVKLEERKRMRAAKKASPSRPFADEEDTDEEDEEEDL